MSDDDLANRDLRLEHPILRFAKFAMIVVVLGVPGYFGGAWVYDVAKTWRAHSLTTQAETLITQGSAAQAIPKLMAAYHLAPHDPEVLRACAHGYAATGNKLALEFFQVLLGTPNVTREDKRAAVRACLLFGNLKGAEGLVTDLNGTGAEAEDVALKAELLWAEHQWKLATSTMKQSLELDPKNREHELLLAQMLFASGGAEGQTEAMNRFKTLAETPDLVGLKALVTMAGDTSLDEEAKRKLLKQLREHPLLNDEARFAAWMLEARLNPKDVKKVLQDVVDFYKGTDPTRKGVAARWLYNQGVPDSALQLAVPPDSSQNQELFLAREDSLAKLKNWQQVEKDLSDASAPLPPTLLFLYRARAEEELGHQPESTLNWERARADAATDEEWRLLGNYAMQMGYYDEARKTFSQMTKIPALAAQGKEYYVQLVKAQSGQGSSAGLIETLKQMMTDLPDEAEPKNDWAYLNLLQNTNVVEASKVSLSLANEHPEQLAFWSTFALSCVRRNDLETAEKVYATKVNVDWTSTTVLASWRMVYAVVLAADGKKDKAAAIAKPIDRTLLRPEEVTLLNTYLPGT